VKFDKLGVSELALKFFLGDRVIAEMVCRSAARMLHAVHASGTRLRVVADDMDLH
jgi:hypothetical protein